MGGTEDSYNEWPSEFSSPKRPRQSVICDACDPDSLVSRMSGQTQKYLDDFFADDTDSSDVADDS